jgi:fluoride exporter
MTLLIEHRITDPAWRLVVVVGFLGSDTTLSSYTFQAIVLMQQGRVLRALTYVLINNVVGLAACYLGIVLARELRR